MNVRPIEANAGKQQYVSVPYKQNRFWVYYDYGDIQIRLDDDGVFLSYGHCSDHDVQTVSFDAFQKEFVEMFRRLKEKGGGE